MPRLPRIHIEGALYYITSRGDHNQDIFKDEEDYSTYLELLNKYKEQYGFKLYSFVLLPNHSHLLIELKQDSTISSIMHDLNSSYIKHFNNRHNRKGHLLQERYRLILVEKEPYLLYMTAYIHLNPRKLNLTKDRENYPFSSYLNYAGCKHRTLNLSMEEEIQEVLSLLPGPSRQTKYEDFLNSIDKEQIQILSKKLHKVRLLGSKAFIDKVRAQIAKSKIQTPAGKLRFNKKFILAGSAAVILLGIVNIILYGLNKQLKGRFSSLSKDKEKEYSQRLVAEKDKIRKDLEGLHRANMVSYDAMARRLEIEKKKVKELEGKIK